MWEKKMCAYQSLKGDPTLCKATLGGGGLGWSSHEQYIIIVARESQPTGKNAS